MSRENVEVIKRHYDAYNRQDMDGALAPLDPDIEIDLSTTEMPETSLRGHAQVRSVFAEQWISGAVQQDPQEFIEVGDGRVVVPLNCRSSGPVTEIRMPLCDVWTLRGGRGVRIEVYPDKASALEAVRLSE